MDVPSHFLAWRADGQSHEAGSSTCTNSWGSDSPPVLMKALKESGGLGGGLSSLVAEHTCSFLLSGWGRTDICYMHWMYSLLWWAPLVSSQNWLPTDQSSRFNKAFHREVTTFVKNSHRYPSKQKKGLCVLRFVCILFFLSLIKPVDLTKRCGFISQAISCL